MVRRLEWIGHASVFANPVVEYNLAAGRIPPSHLKVLRIIARRRIYRGDNGHVRRELRPDSPEGLSKHYQWGPDDAQMLRLRRGGKLSRSEEEACFIQNVSDSDAKIILSDPRCKDEFLDVTAENVMNGPAGQRNGILVPPSGQIEIARAEDLSSLKALTRELPVT